MEEQTQKNSWFNFGNVFEYCLLALVFLVPLAFIPSIYVSLYPVKMALVATVIVLFIASFLASTLSTGIVSLPKSRMLILMAALPLVSLASAFFSGALEKSLAGVVFEIGTVGSVFALVMLLFVAVFAMKKDPTTGVKAIYAFLFSSFFVVLHLIFRVFAPIIPTAISSRIPNFLVGSSIDTAVFLGAIIIAAVSALHMLSLNKRAVYATYALLVLSMLFIGAVSFTPIVLIIGLFALIYFVYIFSWSVNKDYEQKSSRTSLPALIVLTMSVVFLLSGSALSGFLSRMSNLNVIEVRPNSQVTFNLIGNALKQNPVLGVGPNMFSELWNKHKPQEINNTAFWSAEFNSGSGFIPTVVATNGLLGVAVLLAFLGLYLKNGFVAIFSSGADSRFRYVSTTSFFVSLFLWVMTFFYAPGISVLVATFVFTGIFLGTLSPQGIIQNMEFNIFRNPKANFASVFIIVVLLLLSISGGYFVWERVVASSLFQKRAPDAAVRLVPTDVYWRGLAEKYMNDIGLTISSVSSASDLTEAERVNIQRLIADSVESARRAIAWNEKNYQNWFALGRVYEILAANGIQGGVQNARGAYDEAMKRAPTNPAIPLAMARLDALESNLAGARENIAKSITLKNNYTDAYFTLSQLEGASGNTLGAIESAEAAVFVDPQNAALYFHLGILKYNNRDYTGSSSALEQAISLIPNYANARYFLGLSYERLGRYNDAVRQFEEIEKNNPDNAEVKLILENLRAGRNPFTDARAPIDDTPETREELPIEEN